MEDKRRESILDAAIDVFAENGFVDAKMHAIAEKAGVATGVIYSDGFFINKLDLLLTIVLAFWQDLNQKIGENFAENQDPKDKLLGVLLILRGLMLGNKHSVRRFKVLHEALPHIHFIKDSKLAAKRHAITEENRKLLTAIDSIIEEGQNKKEFEKSLHASVLRQILFGSFEMLMYGHFLKISGKEPEIGYGEGDIGKAMNLLLTKFLLAATAPQITKLKPKVPSDFGTARRKKSNLRILRTS